MTIWSVIKRPTDGSTSTTVEQTDGRRAGRRVLRVDKKVLWVDKRVLRVEKWVLLVRGE